MYFRFERQIGHHLIQTFAPSTLVVMLSWFSFWIGLDAIPGRVTLLVTSMLTLVTMFTGLKSDIPPVAYVKVSQIICPFRIWQIKECQLLVPSPAINIDTSVNEAFTADKMNAVKSFADVIDCWYAHYKRTKTFQSSMSHYDGVNRQREPYCCHCSS